MRSEPQGASTLVWALPISLAATFGIDVSFFSSGYLDVSVHRVPGLDLWIQSRSLEVCSSRFPHSEISGSQDICSSPELIAAYHVFRRLLVPRHPPCALVRLTNFLQVQRYLLGLCLLRFFHLVLNIKILGSFSFLNFFWFTSVIDNSCLPLDVLSLYLISVFDFQGTYL